MTFADTERYRPELQAHCYRMLGSLPEAEDAVQETLVRAWRGLDRLEVHGALRNWLYRIATNMALSMLARRSTARRGSPQFAAPPSTGPPDDERASEVLWLEPYPDAALERIPDAAPGPHARVEASEAISLAFAAAIQYLPPRQRAALLLCDVLGWPSAETAGALATSPASVNSALQRARATLKRRMPPAADAPATALRGARDRRLLDAYVAAWERGDVRGVVELLTEDATFSMPPRAQWYRGRGAIAELLTWAWGETGFVDSRLLATGANGQPAFAFYGRSDRGAGWHAHALHVLTLSHTGIAAVGNFMDRSLFAAFDLPRELAAATPSRSAPLRR